MKSKKGTDKILLKDYKRYNRRPFFKRWLRAFAPNLTEEQYLKHIEGGYIWSVFCEGIVPGGSFLAGDRARRAYDSADKSGAICAYLVAQKDGLPLPSTALTAAGIEGGGQSFGEFYVVGKSFAWTYIYTHESQSGIGPFFMERNI